MTASIAVLSSAACLSQVSVDSDPKDFGLWGEVEAEWGLGKKWSIGADFEVRTQDVVGSLARWSAGLGVEFKPAKFLSLESGYSLIDSLYVPSLTSKGNILDEYWRIKNRFYAGARLKAKWGIVRPSLRLRYQLTAKSEVSVAKYKSDGVTRKDNELKESSTENIARTKAALEFKTNTLLTPFASFELYNDLGDGLSLDKSRLNVGTDIKLNKRHALSVGYVRTFYSDDNNDNDGCHNALSIGYKIKM